ncbi:hypothetical protein UlMin_035005 [Ulmus minor]
MEFQLPLVFSLLTLFLVASHATLSDSELYWKSVLPNTPMPKAVTDLLHPAYFTEEKGTAVSVGKGVGVNTGKGTSVGVGKGGVTVGSGGKGKRVYVGVNPPGSGPFLYHYAATETQLHDDPNVALFFLEKDIRPGTKMTLYFTKSSNYASFLSHQEAETIPFSSKKLPEIMSEFSITPGSAEAVVMKKTIKECEAPSIRGEDKYCATSLESMIDFSTSKLGKDVKVISTEVDKETHKQTYTIKNGVEKTEGKKAVVCHKQNYPYAVFYCHCTQNTKSFVLSLEGADGTKAKAVAVCHTDTSAWNPKHLAFQVLKVEPGTIPVCHFLPEDHIVWVPNHKS